MSWSDLPPPVLGAFVGAASAFGFVILNDSRRQRRRAIRSLPARIEHVRFAAQDLLTNAFNKILSQAPASTDVAEHWRSPPLLGLRELATEVNELLTEEARDGAQAICWLLDGIAEQFENLKGLARDYYRKYPPNQVPPVACVQDRITYRGEVEHARDLTQLLLEACNRFLALPHPRLFGAIMRRPSEWIGGISLVISIIAVIFTGLQWHEAREQRHQAIESTLVFDVDTQLAKHVAGISLKNLGPGIARVNSVTYYLDGKALEDASDAFNQTKLDPEGDLGVDLDRGDSIGPGEVVPLVWYPIKRNGDEARVRALFEEHLQIGVDYCAGDGNCRRVCTTQGKCPEPTPSTEGRPPEPRR
jgi:hypothetical protein